ncbi:MAG: GNAT family N-acetyltransferase [Desulfobulbaceae bacterium]|nr:GNAT family N-acetyltransferase [Desulfobulbaceae bacterium]
MTTPSPASNLSATIIKSRPELNLLSPEWNRLLQQSEADSIFLSWEWITSWLDTASPSSVLSVVAVHDDDGHLVAIAPFYLSSLHFLGIFHYRCLRVLGDCNSGGEYPDIMVLPNLEDKAMRIIAMALASSKCEWDCAWIPNIAGWTGAAGRFIAVFGQSNGFFRKRACSFSALKLPGSWSEFTHSLSRNRRSVLQRQEKKLAMAGIIVVERCERDDELPHFLEALFGLHKKRWQKVGQEGSFVRRPKMVDFYRNFAQKAFSNGWLALFSLKINGTEYATQYGYLYNGVYLQLQEGYDPAGPNGSGNALRAEIFRWCIERKMREYDFLGEHTPHKANWCAVERLGWQFFLGRNGFKNIPLNLLKIWPTGRYLYPPE